MSSRHRWILLVVSLAGCSSETSTNSPTTGAPVPVERWAEESGRAECDLLFRCCDTTKLIMDAPGVTHAECAARLAKGHEYWAQELQAAMAAGKVSYDGAAARKCIDALAAQPCDAPKRTFDPACDAIAKGTVADGQACVKYLECASGFCSSDTCQRVPAVGEACAGGTCAAGAYCDPMSSKCATQKPNGTPCVTYNECLSGICEWNSSKTCVAQKPNGSPCLSSDECVSGHCDAGTQTCGTNLCFPSSH